MEALLSAVDRIVDVTRVSRCMFNHPQGLELASRNPLLPGIQALGLGKELQNKAKADKDGHLESTRGKAQHFSSPCLVIVLIPP